MKMKNLMILGDSYSTFEGYIPNGYRTYYSGKPRPETDVCKVTETWWSRFVSAAKANLVLNDSWSGSTIGYTGYNNRDCSKDSSFIYRFTKLLNEGFFREKKIDTVLVFGGTNDSWANAPLGEVRFSERTDGDLFEVLPAICYLMDTMKRNLPNTDILFIVNTELKTEISDCFRRAAEHYRLDALFLHDIDKRCGHPTIKGMTSIFEQVLARFKESEEIR